MAKIELHRETDHRYRCDDPPLTIEWRSLGGKRPYGVWIVTPRDDPEDSVMAHTLNEVRGFLGAVCS